MFWLPIFVVHTRLLDAEFCVGSFKDVQMLDVLQSHRAHSVPADNLCILFFKGVLVGF